MAAAGSWPTSRKCACRFTSCRRGGPSGDGGPPFGPGVERANRSARVEFWNRYDGPLTVAAVTPSLAEYEFFHNYVRPHTALDCRTPNEYLVEIEEHARPDSQSSERS